MTTISKNTKTKTHAEKMKWLSRFATRLGAKLQLEGECGFGRPCVGLTVLDTYPDYPEDAPGIPEDAYHKHNCLAVLGRGEKAEAQLYEWCKALDNAGYNKITIENNPKFYSSNSSERIFMSILGQDKIIAITKAVGRR